MLSPRKRNTSGLAARTAFQIGCGFSWLAPEPKAIHCGGAAGSAAAAVGLSRSRNGNRQARRMRDSLRGGRRLLYEEVSPQRTQRTQRKGTKKTEEIREFSSVFFVPFLCVLCVFVVKLL